MTADFNRTPKPNAKPRRRFCRQKRFLVPAAFLATLYFTAFNGESFAASPTPPAQAEQASPLGKAAEYRQNFEANQAAWLGNPRDNGYRELLAAFGPRFFGSWALVRDVRWEDFPTAPKSKDWFASDWTKHCRKFELDPTARPTFLDRLDVSEYLRLNGIDGTEKTLAERNADVDKFDLTVQLAGGEKRPAKATSLEAIRCEVRLRRAPWTAEEFPVAARWLDENADRFDVYEKAINASKFAVWRYSSAENENSLDYWNDAAFSLETARRRVPILRTPPRGFSFFFFKTRVKTLTRAFSSVIFLNKRRFRRY